MLTDHTPETLRAFSEDIATAFNAGLIRFPVHLDGGNEDALLDIFQNYKAGDWCFCSWRSHYKALLAGVPPETVKAEILAGRSISLCFPDYRFFSSGIAGGSLPIALGVAWQIKQKGGKERVWAFCGDMTAQMGITQETLHYGWAYDLPLNVIVEDNGKSVFTPTKDAWGRVRELLPSQLSYKYEATYPHSGAGRRVQW